jgi:hypothetical protein
VTALSDAVRAREGDWVEVECKLLDPADRSRNLPPETAEKPLMMWVKGFALAEAGMGEELTIETMTGRQVSGALSAVNPGYFITYGNPIPELTHVGRDLRAKLAAYRAAQASPAIGGCGCGCDCAPAKGGEH